VRALFFVHPGQVSRSIMMDMAAGFRTAGHEVLEADLGQVWRAIEQAATPEDRHVLISHATRQLHGLLERQHIDLTLGMWSSALHTFSRSQGVFDRHRPRTLFDQVDVPHVMYWHDAPHVADGGIAVDWLPTGIFGSPSLRSVVNNTGTAQEITDVLGFAHAAVMPHGFNPETFRPASWHASSAGRPFDLAFSAVDGDPAPTQLMIEELGSEVPDVQAIRESEADRVRRTLMHHSCWQGLSPVLLDVLIESQLATRDRPVLQRLRTVRAMRPELAADIDRLLDQPRSYLAVAGIVRSIEHWERPFTYAYLARRFRTLCFGGASWAAWGFAAGDRRITEAGMLAHASQPTAYQQARLGLNVMRWQDDEGMNIKPLEIAGSGTACLCATRRGLGEILIPGQEVLTFDHPALAAAQVREAIARPDAVDEVARAGCRRVHRDHTWAARVPDLLAASQGNRPEERYHLQPADDGIVELSLPVAGASLESLTPSDPTERPLVKQLGGRLPLPQVEAVGVRVGKATR
jgi:spore maturation protein CgeB